MSGRRPTQNKFGAYSSNGDEAFILPPSAKQLIIHTASVENRSGSNANAGILRRYDTSKFAFGKIVDPNPISDESGFSSLNLFEANNDGFLVEADQPFGMVGINVSVAGAGGVYTYEYFDGTSYVALPAPLQLPNFGATGWQVLVFAAPNDWAMGSTPAVGGSGLKYSIRIRSTTAPAPAVTAVGSFAAEFLAFKSQLANDGVLSLDYPDDSPIRLSSLEGLMPFFETANAQNLMTVIYGTEG